MQNLESGTKSATALPSPTVQKAGLPGKEDVLNAVVALSLGGEQGVSSFDLGVAIVGRQKSTSVAMGLTTRRPMGQVCNA